jgi:threonine synthase
MWRWAELLPVIDPGNIVSLGEGDTLLMPLSHLGDKLGLSQLFLKDEGINPTGSFKARGMSSAVSKARELGLEKLAIPSAGNAAGALAAYAARARTEAYVCMPQDTPMANVLECQLAGAQVNLIPGLISDCAHLVGEASRQHGWFDLSTFKEPWRVEGKKIMGYEIAEAFKWSLPDVIIYPTGGGTGLVGMWKAFQELLELGWLESKQIPRMVVVQASGCAPVVQAFAAGAKSCNFWEDSKTIASGLRVPKPFADRLILQVLRESQGTATAVEDVEIIAARSQLGETEGIFCAPEGAATLAGLYHLIDSGWIKPIDQIVLFNTGSGLKYVY